MSQSKKRRQWSAASLHALIRQTRAPTASVLEDIYGQLKQGAANLLNGVTDIPIAWLNYHLSQVDLVFGTGTGEKKVSEKKVSVREKGVRHRCSSRMSEKKVSDTVVRAGCSPWGS